MLSCSNLSKSFSVYAKKPGIAGTIASFFKRDITKKVAVSDMAITIDQGEIVGLLGPNGAGKTTLMKMFTGIIEPSEGELDILGYRPFDRKPEYLKQMALVMGQKFQLWWDIPASDSFKLLKAYYEIEDRPFKQRLGELAEGLDVQHLIEVPVRKLSLGERMKMELISSLLHEPKVIFLDEPTIGLDLVAQAKVREFVKAYHQRNKATILLTSHYMEDVKSLCERIILINGGHKQYDGSLESFESLLGDDKILSLSFAQPQDTKDPFWQGFSPDWHTDAMAVDIRIAEDKLRSTTAEIFARYPVVDFHTENMPVERVLATLMAKKSHLTPSSRAGESS